MSKADAIIESWGAKNPPAHHDLFAITAKMDGQEFSFTINAPNLQSAGSTVRTLERLYDLKVISLR